MRLSQACGIRWPKRAGVFIALTCMMFDWMGAARAQDLAKKNQQTGLRCRLATGRLISTEQPNLHAAGLEILSSTVEMEKTLTSLEAYEKLGGLVLSYKPSVAMNLRQPWMRAYGYAGKRAEVEGHGFASSRLGIESRWRNSGVERFSG